MGTRGLMAFAHDGKLKAMYNHYDSYPTGLGTTITNWIINHTDGDFSKEIEQFNRLEAVREDEKPTEDQKLALLQYATFGVSTGSSDEWYVLLRETQGDPVATLQAGFYFDASDFGNDGLFCEWGYVVDLDKKVLEVYRGFATSPHSSGRWAGGEPRTLPYADRTYYPIELMRIYTFEEIVNVPNIMEVLEDRLEAEEEAAD